MDDVFAMQVHKSFCDLFEYFSEGVIRTLANQVAQTSLWTVLQNDREVLFLVEEEELPCFQDVRMVQGDMHFCLFFGVIFVVFGDGDEFEGVLTFVN